MSADIKSERNQSYKRAAVAGGLLLLLVLSFVIAILVIVLPWKVLMWIAIILVAILFFALCLGFLTPFNPDEIIDSQARTVIGDLDRRLLYLALDESKGQADLDDFLSDWDIEASPIRSVLLAAYIMKTRPVLEFPQTVSPRLNGVLSFCRFQNLKREAHYKKISTALVKEGITPMILKGGAMKVYRPDFPRWMNDIDLLVQADDYDKAIDIAVSLGYGRMMVTDHSVDLHLPDSDEGLLDIHKHLEMFTGREEVLNDGFFARAVEKKFFSSNGLLPSPEDMVFVSLVNFFKNMEKDQTPESSLTTFFDLKFMVGQKAEFDWNVVRENSRLSGAEFQVMIASKIVGSVLKGVFPEGWTDSFEISRKELKKQLVDFLYKRDVLAASRESFSETKVGAAVNKDWNIIVFMWVALVGLIKKVICDPRLKYSIWLIRKKFFQTR